MTSLSPSHPIVNQLISSSDWQFFTLICWSLEPFIKGNLIQNPVYKKGGTSLVLQWLRILQPVQGTGVRPLVWEDSTCRRATKPMLHSYCSLNMLEPTCSGACSAAKVTPMISPCTALEKACLQQPRPGAAKSKHS